MPRLADNSYQQALGESLRDVLLAHGLDALVPPAAAPRRLRHVVSPFAAAPGSPAARIQATTFASMEAAREFAAGAGAAAEVSLRAAVLAADREHAAGWFADIRTLDRSAADYDLFQVRRPLPFLFDIIAAAADGGVEHMILTNVDICPLPHFYLAVSRLLDYGFDALIINRRTVADCGTSADQLPLLWADPGRPHEGYDCFVFGAAAARRFLRNDAVVGAGGVMRGLIYNLVASAQRLLILTDVHLTCHVGDDKEWGRPELRDSIEHNWREAVAVLRPLAAAQPERFADFCANLPDRIRIERPVAGGPRLVRAPGFTGFLPPLDPEAMPESSADDPQR
jgi:hypothetical protein